ncbi:MAG: DinB family protein [Vicinamibacterales bacterium]
MRLSNSFICALLAIGVSSPAVRAQQKPAPLVNPISQAVRDTWESAKRNITESADQMEETDYGFKPTDSVRSFGQILAHVAGASYMYCSAARGEKTPHEEDDFEKTATTKAQIVKVLNDSIAYCDAAYTSLTDRTAADVLPMPFGMKEAGRASSLIRNVGHYQEHYGNLVTYFRIKGMVPPSSRR